MGVSGLMTYCNERRKDISDRIDLVQLARHVGKTGSAEQSNVSRKFDPPPPGATSLPPSPSFTILVDYYAFESYILPKFLLVEKEKGGPGADPHMRIFGGEYDAYDAFVRRFLEALQNVGIVFVFYIDSSRGSSADVAAHKLETWKERFRDTLDFFAEIRRVCYGKLDIQRLRDKLARPCLLTVQTLISIEEAGCELVSCLYDEADSVIGSQLQTRPGAFAVLSHDSDFAVMRGCRFIPIDWFDIHGHLMEFVTRKKQVITSLIVDVTTPEKIAFSLGLPSPQSLVELAILKGNDFTRPFLKNMNLRQHLGLRNFSLQNFAGWVARYGSMERSDYFWHAMRTNPEFRSAVSHSREFYAAGTAVPSTQIPRSTPSAPHLTSFMESGVASGEFPLVFLAMHRGFYWHRELLGVPNVEVALLDLRRILYDMLLPASSPPPCVVEYYRNETDELEKRNVFPQGRYPTLIRLSTLSEEDRIAIFSDVFLSLEDGDDVSVKRLRSSLSRDFTLEERFIVLIMRYFLKLTRAFDLRLSRAEAEAVIGSVLDVVSSRNVSSGRVEPSEKRREAIPSAVIVPSFRCLTIFNWLQEIYLYAFNLFGKALKLQHSFPRPRELFKGTVFVRFFMATAGNEGISRGCREEIDKLFADRYSMVDAVFEGLEF